MAEEELRQILIAAVQHSAIGRSVISKQNEWLAVRFRENKAEIANLQRQLSVVQQNFPKYRLIWDSLCRMADPQAETSFRRIMQKARSDYGQEFWWKPDLLSTITLG